MKIILSTLKKILFWSYDRGSWQYDLMCVLILAFIFLAPNKFFQTRATGAPPISLRASELGPVSPNDLEGTIQNYLNRSGHPVSISRIEQAVDASGETSYVVYPK